MSAPVALRPAVAIGLALLGVFGVVHALQLPLVGEQTPDLGDAGASAAAASFGLLVVDVVLPVPSSGVMVANGALFGPVGGAALSLAGSEAAALLGWVIGRRGIPLFDRVASQSERRRAAAAIERHGAVAIVVTRPVPILAETATILAGVAGMPLRRVALAAAAGSLPPAVLYALAGSLAARFSAAALVLAGVVAIAALVWMLERRR